MAKEIIIPYKPRFPQVEIHPNLEKHRFCVLVAHRRMGKSVLGINHMIKMAIMNSLWQPHYAYIAPFRNQAKLIAWEYLKKFTGGIPGVKVNESELWVEFLGKRIYLFGADNPDSIRGPYWDGVILDEYAQIRPEVWGEIIMPSLSDRKGWAVFSGTPKGQNAFYDVYLTAQRLMNEGDPNWWCGLYRADETGVIPEDELELLRKSVTENQFRQEFLCDFSASADNILITIDIVTDAIKRVKREEDILGAPKVLGIDVARFGGDKSVIFPRQGLMAFKPMVYSGIDNMTFVGIIAQKIQEWKPDAVFIDSGRGEGVIDRLRQLSYDVTEVNFGGKAVKSGYYFNKRTEMWDELRLWLQAGGAIPNDIDLKTDLVVPQYKFDAQNRMHLESKDDIKKRLGKSPDLADALALTFAYPVASKSELSRFNINGRSNCFANANFNPFKKRR